MFCIEIIWFKLYSGRSFKYFASIGFTEDREYGRNDKPGNTVNLTDADFDWAHFRFSVYSLVVFQ